MVETIFFEAALRYVYDCDGYFRTIVETCTASARNVRQNLLQRFLAFLNAVHRVYVILKYLMASNGA